MDVGGRRCAGRTVGVGEDSGLVVGQGLRQSEPHSLTADVSLLGLVDDRRAYRPSPGLHISMCRHIVS